MTTVLIALLIVLTVIGGICAVGWYFAHKFLMSLAEVGINEGEAVREEIRKTLKGNR